MKKAYVIGTDVSTSLSPAVFEYWFKKYDVNAEYGFIEIKEKKFDQEIKSILKIKDLIGINITIPFKERILPYLTKKKETKPIWNSNNVKRITTESLLNSYGRPINCITIKNKKIEGTNTDGFGFGAAYSVHIEKKAEEERRPPTPKGKVLVIGFGGAAKSIISSLVEMNFDTIVVFNRTFEKIKSVGTEIYEKGSSSSFPICEIIPEKIDNLINHTNHKKSKNTKLIVNTSPTNILNNKTNWNIGGGVVGFDIVYKPREGTGFLSNFNPKRRIEGVEMLVYQAAPCFKLWFGIEPKVDEEMFKHLYKKLEQNK